MDFYTLNKHCEPQHEPDIQQWSKWFATADRQVAEEEIEGVLILTVFLGLNYSFGCGTPVLWETMIFNGKYKGYKDRYSTRKEALDGHQHAVDLVRGITEKEPRQ